MENLGTAVDEDTIAELDDNGLLKRNFDNPPLKDTVTVPSAGYTIVRFIASNPGMRIYMLICISRYNRKLLI